MRNRNGLENHIFTSLTSCRLGLQIEEARLLRRTFHLDILPRVLCFLVLFDLMMALRSKETYSITLKNLTPPYAIRP